METHLPYFPTQERVVNGFSKIRIVAADFGTVNFPISVLEIFAPIRERAERLRKKKGELDPPGVDDLSAQDDIDDELLPDYVKKVLRAGQVARLVAQYFLNPDGGQMSAWVHPDVMKNEVEPMQRLHAKWGAERRADMAQTFTVDSFATGGAGPEASEQPIYVSIPALKKSENVSKDSGLGEDKQANILRMTNTLVNCISQPIFAPMFTGQHVLAEEPQVDQLIERQRGYIKQGNRDPKLFIAMCEAVKSAPSAEVAEEIIRQYRHFHGMDKDPSPKNWGMSIAFTTAVKTMDKFYGFTSRRFIMLHGRKFANASYLQDRHNEYFTDKAMSDSRRYTLRKLGPTELLKMHVDQWKKKDPRYKEFETWLTTLDKLDDVGDSIGIGLDWANQYLRFTPFNEKELEIVKERAKKLFLDAMKKVSVQEDMQKKSEEKVAAERQKSFSLKPAAKKGPPPPRIPSSVPISATQADLDSLTGPPRLLYSKLKKQSKLEFQVKDAKKKNAKPGNTPAKQQFAKKRPSKPAKRFSDDDDIVDSDSESESESEHAERVKFVRIKKRPAVSENIIVFSGSEDESEHYRSQQHRAPLAKRRKVIDLVDDGDDDVYGFGNGSSGAPRGSTGDTKQRKKVSDDNLDGDDWFDFTEFEKEALKSNPYGAV